jgi:hypothetical protein
MTMHAPPVLPPRILLPAETRHAWAARTYVLPSSTLAFSRTASSVCTQADVDHMATLPGGALSRNFPSATKLRHNQRQLRAEHAREHQATPREAAR